MVDRHQNSALAVEKISATDRTDAIERSKSLQASYLASLEAPLVDYTTKHELQKIYKTTFKSAPLKTAAMDNFSKTKPTLPLLTQRTEKTNPTEKRALGIELAEAIQRNEEVIGDIVGELLKNIKHQSHAIVELSKNDREHLNDLIAQLAKNEDIEVVKSILNVVTASTAIVAGSIILAPETLALIASSAALSSISSAWGYLLIATGLANVTTNEILPRFDLFNKIASYFTDNDADKQKLADNIQVTTSLTNTILSIASSIATTPILGAVLKWSSGFNIFKTGTNLLSGTVNISSDINQSKYKNLQAEQTKLDGKLDSERFKLDMHYKDLQSATDLQKTFNQMSFDIFQILEKMSQQNTR